MVTTYILGGKGTMSGRKDVNGGGYNPSLITWDQAQGANGLDLAVSTSPSAEIGAADNGGNYVRLIGGAGDFTGSLVGVVAYVAFTTIYTAGHYEVMGTDDDTWIDIDLPYSSNANTDLAVVGGAYGDATGDTDVELQWALDILDAGDVLKIRDDLTFNLNTTTVDCDGNDGSQSARITVESVDTDGVRLVAGDSKPTIQPFGSITGALIKISNTTTYWDWHGLNLNGTVGAFTADYCIYNNDATSIYHRFFSCDFHDTDASCVYVAGTWDVFEGCEFYGSASRGAYSLAARGAFIGCSFHDNATHGLYMEATSIYVADNVSYNNGSDGIHFGFSADRNRAVNNTCYGNGADGIQVRASTANGIFFNNTCVNNDAYGFNLDGNIDQFVIFANNHSYDNGSGHYSEGNDGSWADAGNGNNITGDPLFTSITGSLTSVDHTGPEYTVTDSGASSPFYAGMVGKSLHITNTGTIGKFVLGRYGIVSYTNANEIALDADPTGGAGDDGAGAFVFVDNFTPKYGSALLRAGFPDSFEGGVDGRYTNYPNIGAVSPALLYATIGRGFGRGMV